MIKNNLNKLLFLINSILLLLLLVSYIVPMVHPDYFWHISFLVANMWNALGYYPGNDRTRSDCNF